MAKVVTGGKMVIFKCAVHLVISNENQNVNVLFYHFDNLHQNILTFEQLSLQTKDIIRQTLDDASLLTGLTKVIHCLQYIT